MYNVNNAVIVINSVLFYLYTTIVVFIINIFIILLLF